jgi:hypothetical protein
MRLRNTNVFFCRAAKGTPLNSNQQAELFQMLVECDKIEVAAALDKIQRSMTESTFFEFLNFSMIKLFICF